MENKRTQIVKLAVNLIREKGYLALGYDEIAHQLGISRAAIHYHFEKKEDLGIAVTSLIMQDLNELDMFLKNSTLTVTEKINHFIVKQVEPFSDNEICAISSLQADVGSLPDQIRHKLQEVSQLELNVMIHILSEAHTDKASVNGEEVEELATTILSAIKGALQYSRVLDRDLYPKVVRQIMKLIHK
jgi:TetR/AcrR family transcriptional repressor of nem operon